MNDELRFTNSIRQALDESTERLPWRVTHRLEQARKAALARAPEAVLLRPATVQGAAGVVGLSAGAAGSYALPGASRRTGPLRGFDADDGARPSLAWRVALILLPLAILVAGLIGFSELESMREADEVAELEAAVLADDVPISAYADRGFGVFLKNSNHGDSQ